MEDVNTAGLGLKRPRQGCRWHRAPLLPSRFVSYPDSLLLEIQFQSSCTYPAQGLTGLDIAPTSRAYLVKNVLHTGAPRTRNL